MQKSFFSCVITKNVKGALFEKKSSCVPIPLHMLHWFSFFLFSSCVCGWILVWSSEFSETPNPAYFYAYFCFCTRKISFRGFSFTIYCHRMSKLNFKGLPKFLLSIEIDTRDVQKLSKSLPTFNELYDVCPAYLLEIRYLCWQSFKDVLLSACGSFIYIGVKRRGTLLMAAWSLCVFVMHAELINWCLYN